MNIDDNTEFQLGSANNGVDKVHVGILEAALHNEWALGRNIVLNWVPCASGIDVLVVPHYMLSNFISDADHKEKNLLTNWDKSRTDSSHPEDVIRNVIAGSKKCDEAHLEYLSRLFGYSAQRIDLPFTPGIEVPDKMVEAIVKRYGITYVEDCAVALFDIVGFSLLSPLDQVTQLNSLAYSINSAHSKMLHNDIYVNFARSTTGDGFYIWNRGRNIQSNVELYHFMQLILADNAITRKKSPINTTPILRTGFHVGGNYKYFQSEGLSPTVYSYIVGDVTIELARMVDHALPGQVLVGDFRVAISYSENNTIRKIAPIEFNEQAQESLSSLNGLILSGDKIDSIKCYLTGEKTLNGEFTVHKYMIVDKHFKGRYVYNAKINIYREGAEPFFLGLPTDQLEDFNAINSNFVYPASRTHLKLSGLK